MQQLRQEATVPEYADAFRSIRAAKFWMSLLLILTLLIYLATFLVAELNLLPDGTTEVKPAAKSTNIATPPKPAAATQEATAAKDDAATKPSAGEGSKAPAAAPKASAGGSAKPAEPPSEWRATCKILLAEALPALKFLAFVAAILLSVTLLLAFKVALTGQLGGVSSLISAFFWSLILLVFLTPWDILFPFTAKYVGLFTSGIDQIRQHKEDLLGRLDKPTALIQYYGKFVAWPAIALLIWVIVTVKFGRGYSRLNFPTAISGTSFKE